MKETKITFNDYLIKIKEDFNLTNSTLSSILGCSAAQVSLFLNKKSLISYNKIQRVVEWLKGNGKDIYSDYVFKNVTNGYYYHGSRQGIDGDISPVHNSKDTLDFGKGFYLGSSFLQSSTFVVFEDSGYDRIYRFSLDLTDLNILEINNLDWVFFVAYSRGKIPFRRNTTKLYQKMQKIADDGYDVVMGPIADDRMAPSMRAFFANTLKYEQLFECLNKLSIGNQWCLKTKKACERLICEEVYIIADNYLRQLIRDYATKNIDAAVKTSYNITLDKRKSGKTFDELLKEYGNK